MGNEQIQAAFKELQDTMVVMAHIEKNMVEIREELDRLIGPNRRSQDCERGTLKRAPR
jgi:hypothetical protein